MTDRLDDLSKRSEDSQFPESEQLDNLVTKALGVLASRRVPFASALSEHFTQALCDAVLSDDPAGSARVLASMREARVTVQEIIDHYIPNVARGLGRDWHENRRSFADVTIGSARLQGLLRDLSDEDCPDPIGNPNSPGVAVIVMEGEYHTLGAMVFSQQLRRAGASVRLIVGRREDEILDIVAQDQFDALVLSLSRVEVLASARKLVEKLRSATSLPAPVVVGGAVAEHETKLMKLTGADHVASDARDALFKCGLKTFQNGAKLRAIPR